MKGTTLLKARKVLLAIVGIALASLLSAYLFLPTFQPTTPTQPEPEPEFPTGKTLLMDLDGIRVRLIEIKDSSIGGDVDIKGSGAYYIYVERLVLRNVVAENLNIKSTVSVRRLVLKDIQADGLDLAPIAGAVTTIAIYGYTTEPIHRAKLVVDALTITCDASDSYVKEIIIENLDAKEDIILERIKADEIIVEGGIFGDGDWLTTPNLIVDATVEELVIEDVVETKVEIT